MARLNLLTFFVLGFCQLAFSQHWKTLYDKSKDTYEAARFSESIGFAEQALIEAKKTDQKAVAYTLQLITAGYLESGAPEKGLAFSAEEVKTFAQLEGENSKHFYEAVRKQSDIFYRSGQLSSAIEKKAYLSKLAGNIYGHGSYQYYLSRFGYAQVLMDATEFELSQHIWEECLPQLKLFPEGSEDYFYGLFYAAFVDYKLSAWPEALNKLKEFITIAEKSALQQTDEYKQANLLLTELQTKITSPSSPQSLQQFVSSAVDLQNKMQWDLALEQYSQAEKYITAENRFTPSAFSYYVNFAKLLYELSKCNQSYAALEEAKEIAAKLFHPDGVEAGYILYQEAALKLESGNSQEAQQLYLNAFAKLKNAPVGLQSKYLIQASRSFLNRAEPQRALALLEPLSSTTGIEGADTRHQLDYISACLTALQEQSLFDKALNFIKEKTATAPATLCHTLNIRQAEILEASGHWQEAATLLKDILKSPGLDTNDKAEATYQLARTQQQLGKYADAEINYHAALDICSQLKPGLVCQVNNSLGTFYTQLGNFEAAEKIYLAALQSTSMQNALTNTLKQNLATIYQQTNRLKAAQQLLEEVVQAEKKRPTSCAHYAASVQNLAALYQQQGDYAKAELLYNEAMAIESKNLSEQSAGYATKLANLATVYLETGDLVKAREGFVTALKIRETTLGSEHPDYVFNQFNLAVLYERMKSPALALPLYKRVSSFYAQHICDLFPVMSEQEKSSFYNKIQPVINAYKEFVVTNASLDKSMLSDLLNFQLQTKALLLNSSMAIRNRILNSGKPELIAKFTNWLQTKERLAMLASLPADQRLLRKSEVEMLEKKANVLEKELSTASQLFSSLTENSSANWRSIQAALRPGEAVIEMIRLRLNLKNDSVIYGALIVKPGMQNPLLVILPEGRKMEKREFAYYRNTMKYLITNERSYHVYWKPLEAQLADVSTIYFSADGVYNKINLQTLYNPGKKQYLIDVFAFKYISNPKEVLINGTALAASTQACLVGFPDYLLGATAPDISSAKENQSASVAFALVRGGLEALPGTKEEVSKIEALLKANQWRVNSYLCEKATEEIIKTQQSPGLVHIATHGFFIPEPNENMQVANSKNILNAESNPLLRSGLMLAGAEKNLLDQLMGKSRLPGTEDGVLTAYEAMNMNLNGTELVVLSACETGAGEIRNGEGVYGLQRAFLVAGARSVLMSLWKVNDEATQELMVIFYKHWLTLKDKRKALQQTQQDIRTKLNEPFYWGGFVMIGE